jgi:hypothetical protein
MEKHIQTMEERLSKVEQRLKSQDARLWVLVILVAVMLFMLMSFKDNTRKTKIVYQDKRFGTMENDSGKKSENNIIETNSLASAKAIVERLKFARLDNLEAVIKAQKEKEELKSLIKSDSLVKAKCLADYRLFSRAIVQARTKLVEEETKRVNEQNERLERKITELNTKLKSDGQIQANLRLLEFSKEFRPHAKMIILGKEALTADWIQRHKETVIPMLSNNEPSIRELAESCQGLFILAQEANRE